MPSLLNQLRWGGAQAGASLTLASSGWLLSGMTSSPLINSLLPALTTLPALLPLRRRSSGFALQFASALVMVALCGAALAGLSTKQAWGIVTLLIAALLMALGQDLSQLPLQRHVLRLGGLEFRQLRRGTELGVVVGSLLTGLIVPGVHQFLPALVLLAPLLPTAFQAAQRGDTMDSSVPPFDRSAALQGLLFGSFFALMPLWVRSVAAGNCFNFGMVLTGYGIGRSLMMRRLRLPRGVPYVAIAALLVVCHGTPGWWATALFIPVGWLAACSDVQLVERIAEDDPAAGWQILQRSGAIGGLIGILLMGSFAQLVGLSFALPMQLALFCLAPLLLRARLQAN